MADDWYQIMTEYVSQQQRIVFFYLIIVALFVSGIAISATGQWLFSSGITLEARKETPALQRTPNSAVLHIATADELRSATAGGRCILFVDCDWNERPILFRRPLTDFADWCSKNTDYKVLSVKLADSQADSQDELWAAIQELWQRYAISPGGMKTMGGAGRVVWFNEGRVVDYAWCWEVGDKSKLESRTKDAF